MNIAICDDDENFCQTLCKMVQVYLQNANLDAQLHIFASGEELCQAMHHEQIALVFLDIELTGMNGVDVGHILRHSQNSDVQIVYVSAKEEYAMQLFQNHPFDFLVKPISQNRLYMLMDEYFRIFPQEERYFSYTSDRKKAQIDTCEILYFESVRKQLRMMTINGTILIYSKLSDILKLRFSHRFLRIHQSFLVNTQHIAQFRYQEVILTDGTTLPISRSYQDSVRDYMMQHSQERAKRRNGI